MSDGAAESSPMFPDSPIMRAKRYEEEALEVASDFKLTRRSKAETAITLESSSGVVQVVKDVTDSKADIPIKLKLPEKRGGKSKVGQKSSKGTVASWLVENAWGAPSNKWSTTVRFPLAKAEKGTLPPQPATEPESESQPVVSKGDDEVKSIVPVTQSKRSPLKRKLPMNPREAISEFSQRFKDAQEKERVRKERDRAKRTKWKARHKLKTKSMLSPEKKKKVHRKLEPIVTKSKTSKSLESRDVLHVRAVERQEKMFESWMIEDMIELEAAYRFENAYTDVDGESITSIIDNSAVTMLPGSLSLESDVSAIFRHYQDPLRKLFSTCARTLFAQPPHPYILYLSMRLPVTALISLALSGLPF